MGGQALVTFYQRSLTQDLSEEKVSTRNLLERSKNEQWLGWPLQSVLLSPGAMIHYLQHCHFQWTPLTAQALPLLKSPCLAAALIDVKLAPPCTLGIFFF